MVSTYPSISHCLGQIVHSPAVNRILTTSIISIIIAIDSRTRLDDRGHGISPVDQPADGDIECPVLRIVDGHALSVLVGGDALIVQAGGLDGFLAAGVWFGVGEDELGLRGSRWGKEGDESESKKGKDGRDWRHV